MYYLVNGVVATGDGVFLPGRSMSPTESTIDSESPNTSATSLNSDGPSSILHDTLAKDIMDGSDDPKLKVKFFYLMLFSHSDNLLKSLFF